jgi:hypothetical protein
MTTKAALSSDSIAGVIGSTIACVGSSPVLALCRKLVEIGYPSSADLPAYRGDMLCLTVRSIGQAAGLEINAKGTGFAPRRAVRQASPVSVSSIAAF